MSGTRDQILQTLLRKPRSTINELAEAVGINPISVRHHLTNLQVSGLIAAEEEHHGVGRPRLIYSLTIEGQERFPSRYLRLSSRLLDQLKETMPKSLVTKLFSQMADSLVEDYAEQLQDKNMEERLEFIQEILGEEGFIIEWEKVGNQYKIHEISCPYYQIGQSHPEVCTVDQILISKMLAVPVDKVQCILNGDTQCTYVIQSPTSEKIS